MEQKNQPQGNAPMPKNPKPSDEVQLNIETVTPETESKDITQEQSKDQTVNPEDSKDKQNIEPKTNTPTDSSEQPATDELSKDGDHPDEARDQIETINP